MQARLTLLVIVVLCATTSSAVAQRQVVEWLALARNEEAKAQRRQQRKLYLTKLIESMKTSS